MSTNSTSKYFTVQTSSSSSVDNRIKLLEARLCLSLFDYQTHFIKDMQQSITFQARKCLYYRTGAGKTVTALGALFCTSYMKVLVIAPPITHDVWKKWAEQLNMDVETISHAKFRQSSYKLDKNIPIIADEFHLFGGHTSVGWKKLERAARGLNAPVIIMSATPNYNDVERVYCVQKILHPEDCTGGFLQFLYQNCETKQNPFSITPEVLGFLDKQSAEEHLRLMSDVFHVPDTAAWIEIPVALPYIITDGMADFNYSSRSNRIMASQMERHHEIIRYTYLTSEGRLRLRAKREFTRSLPTDRNKPVLVFANHETIATALFNNLRENDFSCEIITGKTSQKEKLARVDRFRFGDCRILIGTASLATGTDGLDKVCDRLIIFQNTDDNALRRQLIGRILPRGADSPRNEKSVFLFQNQ